MLLPLVVVKSDRGQSASGGILITGNALGLAQVPACFLQFRQNIARTCSLTPTGGTGQGYSFTYVSGAFPAGIANVTSTGVIAGTPTGTSSGTETFKICDSSLTCTPNQSITITPITLVSIALTPASSSVNTAATLQFQSTGTWNDGSIGAYVGGQPDLTSLAAYSCPSGTGCTGSSVSATGLLTAGSTGGPATVQASFNSINGSTTVTVVAATITITNNITLPNCQVKQSCPDTAVGSIGIGAGTQLNATGGTPGGACPLGYNWTLVGGSFPAGETLSTCGIVSGTPTTATGSPYAPQIKACDNAGTPNCTTVTFSQTIATVSAITDSPTNPSTSVGLQQKFFATATYSPDSTTNDVTVGTSGIISWTHGVGVNSGNTLSNTATKSVTLNSVPVGSIIVCGLDDVTGSGSTETLNSVVDQNSNAYTITPHSPTTYTTNIGMNWVAYFLSALTGTNTITATWSASNFNHLGCDPYTPSGGTASFDTDVAATNAAASTTVSSPSITPTGAGELLFNSTNTSQTITAANNPWLIASGGTFAGGVANEYILNSGSTAVAASYAQTPSGVYSGITAAFSIIPIVGGPGTLWTATDVAPGKNVATVTSSGLATCISAGQSTIKAAIGAVNGTTTLTCNAVSTDTALIISPPAASVNNGSSQPYTVKGNVTGNDYTSAASFSSDATGSVVAITNNSVKCIVGGGQIAHVSGSNGTIGTGSSPATQTCLTPAQTGSLLTGYTVTAANNISGPTPSGWTLLRADGFESGSLLGSESFVSSTNSITINCTSSPAVAHTGSCYLDSFITHSYGGYGLKINGSFVNHREVYLSYWAYSTNSNPGFGHVYVDWYQMTRSPSGGPQGIGIIPDSTPAVNTTFGGLTPESSLFGALAVTPPQDWSKFGATFPESPGIWVQIEQHLKVNDPGLTNGDYEWWQNGVLMLICNVANNCPSTSPGNFVGSADYTGADLYAGGDWGALNFFTDATHSVCQNPPKQTNFGLSANMPACTCAAQCPPNGNIPPWHRLIDDVIVLVK